MARSALSQTHAALRQRSIAGAERSAKPPKLTQLSEAIEQHRAPIFTELSARLVAASQPEPAPLLRAFALSRALLSTQTSPAPKGAIAALPARCPGEVSGRLSTRTLSALQAALTSRAPKRLQLLKDEAPALFDLRVAPHLVAALGDPQIGEPIKSLMLAQSSLSEALRSDLELGDPGTAAGDARRLSVLSASDEARGRKLAHHVLGLRPKPALRAQAYLSLAGDSSALDLLIAGAKKGPAEARRAALSALARREEPAALAVLLEAQETAPRALKKAALAALAQRSEPAAIDALEARLDLRAPLALQRVDFDLLEEAFSFITAPSLRAGMQAALLDKGAPILTEKDIRVRWAAALAKCPADAASVEALATACAEGWAPCPALVRVGHELPLERLRALLLPEARAAAEAHPIHHGREPDAARTETVYLLRVAATRMGPSEFYERFGPSMLRYEALREAIVWERGFRWSNEPGELQICEDPLPPIRWDPRWLRDALKLKWVDLIAQLVGRGGDPADEEAAAALLIDRLPEQPPGEALYVLRALDRAAHPRAAELALDYLSQEVEQKLLRHNKLGRSLQDASELEYDLVDIVALLSAAERPGLASLQEDLQSAQRGSVIMGRLQRAIQKKL